MLLFLALELLDFRLFFFGEDAALLIRLGELHCTLPSTFLDLLEGAKLNLVEVFGKLDEREFLDVELVCREVGHAATGGAGEDRNGVPVHQFKQLLIVEELGRQLELKDALAAAPGTRRDRARFVTVADPEWDLHKRLLL